MAAAPAKPKAGLWAWQNPHVTKKIADDERVEQPKNTQKRSTSKDSIKTDNPEPTTSGKGRGRRKRPTPTLKRAMVTLHLLLRSSSFNRLPLAVRFFASDVYEAWLKHSKVAFGEIREGLQVTLDVEQVPRSADADERPDKPQSGKRRKLAEPHVGGVHDIDITYSGLKGHLEKSSFLLGKEGSKNCAVCADRLDVHRSAVITCPSHGCQAMSHMTCLATARSGKQPMEGFLLPIVVVCPKCNKEHQWVGLMRELSLRIRSRSALAQVVQVSQDYEGESNGSSDLKSVSNATDAGHDAVGNDRSSENVLTFDSLMALDFEDDPFPESWHELGADSDAHSEASTKNGVSSRQTSPWMPSKHRQRLPSVIEDSEWDSAEALD
ncbi:MAG: hypothetical protein Q9219_004354 [cf. Caloplaca sp. 3 TL-2023]